MSDMESSIAFGTRSCECEAPRLTDLGGDHLARQVAVDEGGLTAARKSKIAEVRAKAKQMDEWRASHGGGKIPD